MELIRNKLLPFKTVTLDDLDKVKLMNRSDSKFCMHITQLPHILEALYADYSILEINGKSIFNYDNTYFDTPDNQMYLSHQNGKRNRFKIRVRNYIESNLSFLEIKFKNNKGRTIKDRIEKQDFIPEFTSNENIFLKNSCPYTGNELEPKINSFFKRFTLVNDQYTERVTFDIFPGFSNHEKTITLNNLVILEIKQDKSSDTSRVIKIIQSEKICRNGFSKYCIGRSILEDNIKKNNFKPLLLSLKKHYFN
ncbi:MAG: polyphosphate polymerase domain-containing protein [Bacteroidia bacterium]